MTDRVSKPTEVFLFVEGGGEDKGKLSLSLTRDDPDDLRVPVRADELAMLQGLYALAPHRFRRMMNVLIHAAYQHGFSKGFAEAEEDGNILSGTILLRGAR